MIYFVTGTERARVRKTLDEIVGVLQKKRPNALLFRIGKDEWDTNTFTGIAGGQGLFEHKYIVVLESLFEDEGAAEYLKDQLKELKGADHAFLFVEYSPKAPVKKLLEKNAEKTWDVEAKEVAPKKEFNIFALTDALGNRNRVLLWTLYQKALMNGSEPEEIHGILFWQVKSLLGISQSRTADEAGVKPFVWSKSQQFLRNYSQEELKKISSEMVSLYHLSRIESGNLEDSLEEFVLSV